jgi:cysteine desulfurase
MLNQIYLDYASTTPVDRIVAQEMAKYLTIDQHFGNPASSNHDFGLRASIGIDESRLSVAQLIHADPREIIFTSGATESDNLAIKGAAFSYRHRGKHIITSNIEHRAVIDTCGYLELQGFEVTYLEADSKGQIKSEQVRMALRDDTILISIMAVNNELGTCYPLYEIGSIAREKKILFHVDASQGVGK